MFPAFISAVWAKIFRLTLRGLAMRLNSVKRACLPVLLLSLGAGKAMRCLRGTHKRRRLKKAARPALLDHKGGFDGKGGSIALRNKQFLVWP